MEEKKSNGKTTADLLKLLRENRDKLALAISATLSGSAVETVVPGLAGDTADAFISFVSDPKSRAAVEQGAALVEAGFREEVIAGLWAPLLRQCSEADGPHAGSWSTLIAPFVAALLEAALGVRRTQWARDRELLSRSRTETDQVNRLAGNYAHDLNNVFTAISGFLQLLLLETEPGTQIEADAARMKGVVEHGADLVRQLRLLSRGADRLSQSTDNDEAGAQSASADTALEAKTTPTILVVDDETTVREVMARTLAARGYAVRSVGNGADAIKLFLDGAEPFDCVVLDVIMPNLGGVETLKRLKAIRPAVPVLIVTGSTEAGLEARLVSKGADGYMQKPIDLPAFSDRVAALIGSTKNG